MKYVVVEVICIECHQSIPTPAESDFELFRYGISIHAACVAIFKRRCFQAEAAKRGMDRSCSVGHEWHEDQAYHTELGQRAIDLGRAHAYRSDVGSLSLTESEERLMDGNR